MTNPGTQIRARCTLNVPPATTAVAWTAAMGRHEGGHRPGDREPEAVVGSIGFEPSEPKTSGSKPFMQGDIILVGDEHRRAAGIIVDHLIDEILGSPRCFTMTVAGESGSGKSETAQALAEALGERGVKAVVLQQDDYYVLPPRFNDAARRANFAWVGTTEVRLDLLDEHLRAAQSGDRTIVKPLVIYAENRIDEEEISYEGARVVIAEGVYTSQCDSVDCRIFIDRNRLETIEHRMKRGREEFDPFIEKVLTKEHEIISVHRDRAAVIITRDYDVEFDPEWT